VCGCEREWLSLAVCGVGNIGHFACIVRKFVSVLSSPGNLI
jgi:hypothetical protein